MIASETKRGGTSRWEYVLKIFKIYGKSYSYLGLSNNCKLNSSAGFLDTVITAAIADQAD